MSRGRHNLRGYNGRKTGYHIQKKLAQASFDASIRRPKLDIACAIYQRTGRCDHVKTCKYQHIPEHRALCQAFLKKGVCTTSGHSGRCLLSHEPTPQNTPLCIHFARNNCTKTDCRYAHMYNLGDEPLKADICRSFALNGYCSRGISCTRKHTFDCPEFELTGSCSNPKCRLEHSIVATSSRKVVDIKDDSINIPSFIDFLLKVDKNDFDKSLYVKSAMQTPELAADTESGPLSYSESSSEEILSDSNSNSDHISTLEFDNNAEFVSL